MIYIPVELVVHKCRFYIANTWTYLDGEKQQEGIRLVKTCIYLVSNSSLFCSFVYFFFHPLLDTAAHGSPSDDKKASPNATTKHTASPHVF